MSTLSDIVNVTIQVETAGIPRESFGFPLILASHASIFGTDLVKQYAELSEMEDAGWVSTDGAYKAAAKMFAQEPKPARVMIGKLTALTQKFRLIPTAGNTLSYSLTVDGLTASFTSDGSALQSEITAGLKLAIDALSVSGCTTTDNTTSLDVSFTAGQFHSVVVAPSLSGRSSGPMSVAETTADVSVAADLAALAVQNDAWYGLIATARSKAVIDIVRGYSEAHEKLFLAATSDSAVPNTALSGTDDVAEAAYSAAAFRTAILYHQDPGEFLDAGLMGFALPQDPGSEKWDLVPLANVLTSDLNATQKANLVQKRVTHYIDVGGTGLTRGGKVAGNEWIDIIRARDAIKSDIQVDVVNLLAQPKKVPYTDGGISRVQSVVYGVLKSYEQTDPAVLVPGSSVVRVPLASAASTADKAARVLNNVRGDSQLAGAISAVNLRVTLSL